MKTSGIAALGLTIAASSCLFWFAAADLGLIRAPRKFSCYGNPDTCLCDLNRTIQGDILRAVSEMSDDDFR